MDKVPRDIVKIIVSWSAQLSIQKLLEWMKTSNRFKMLHTENNFCAVSVLSIALFVFVSENWHIQAFTDWCIIGAVSKPFSALVTSMLPKQETKSNIKLLWSKLVLHAITMHLGYIKPINVDPSYVTHEFKLFVRKEKQGIFQNDQLSTALSQHLPFFIAVDADYADCLKFVLHAKPCPNFPKDKQMEILETHFDETGGHILLHIGVLDGFESITLKTP